MAFYRPLKRESNQKWDYTVTDGSGTYPIGYCASWRLDKLIDEAENPSSPMHFYIESLKAERELKLPYKDKYHDHGHDTAGEAKTCYNRYVSECESQKFVDTEEQHKCAVCGEWTQTYMIAGNTFCIKIHLCEDHATPDNIFHQLEERDKR